MFEMGTGVTLPIKSPENDKYQKIMTIEIMINLTNCNHKNLLAGKFYGQALGLLVLVN